MALAGLQQTPIHEFGPYEFNPAGLELRTGETRKALTPALNRLLLLLVSNQGELVTREQIAQALWDSQGTVDTASGIHVAISRLRTIIGDNNGHGVYIQTVVGAGYRFVAPVTVVEVPADVPLAVPPPDPEHTTAVPAWRNVAVFGGCLLLAAGAAWPGMLLWQNARTGGQAITQLTGQSRPVTFNDVDDKVIAEAISPSGKLLAYADKQGITVQNIAGGESKVVAGLKGFQIERIAWFRDEASVLVSADVPPENSGKSPGAAKSQVWRVPLAGEAPRLLIEQAAMAVPSPDGKGITYLKNGKTELWTSGAHAESPRMLAQARNGDTFGFLLWSSRGDRIITDRIPAELLNFAGAKLVPAGDQAERQKTQGRSAYESYNSHTGALLAHRDNVQFTSAVSLADGTLIYLVNQPVGTTRFAVASTDPSTGAFEGDPDFLSGEQAFGAQINKAEDISATSDGKALAVILERRNVDVYTAGLAGSDASSTPLAHAVRLTRHGNGNYPTSWTSDSKSVIFDTGINGPISIAVQALNEVSSRHLVAAKLPTDRFAQGKISPDGRWLLYLHLAPAGDKVANIERVPLTGGPSEIVPASGEIEGLRCSSSPAGRCVVRKVDGNKQFVYYELDPLFGIGREVARTSLVTYIRGDWDLSPDGRTVAVADHDPAHPSIQLVHLSSANGPDADSLQAAEVPVPGYGVVLSQSWAADGRSLFVQTTTPGQRHLLRADLQGHLSLLGHSPHLLWAVPSPDGKKIAFPADTEGNRNVWLGTMRLKAGRHPS